MVLVGVLTGLRIGEILGLRWRDVYFRSGEIRVPKQPGSQEIDIPALLCHLNLRPQGSVRGDVPT
jgi:integrase